MNNEVTEKVHRTSNDYAKERIEEALNTIEAKIRNSSGSLIYTRSQVEKIIGFYLASSYAKGFADCYERKEQKSLII
jgi:hypothetical protein